MQAVGWVLLVAGVVILVGFWVGAVLGSTPLLLRLGLVAIAAGLAALFASVVRDRIRERKTEHFDGDDR